MTKEERPSVTETDVHCSSCSDKKQFWFTNEEKRQNVELQVYCGNCKRVTIHNGVLK